jgi:hypothetical protein
MHSSLSNDSGSRNTGNRWQLVDGWLSELNRSLAKQESREFEVEVGQKI